MKLIDSLAYLLVCVFVRCSEDWTRKIGSIYNSYTRLVLWTRNGQTDLVPILSSYYIQSPSKRKVTQSWTPLACSVRAMASCGRVVRAARDDWKSVCFWCHLPRDRTETSGLGYQHIGTYGICGQISVRTLRRL